MTAETKPKLRPLQPIPVKDGGQQLICLRDASGLTDTTIALSPHAFFLAALCDGQHSLRDIQLQYMRKFGDLIMTEKIEEVVSQLDQALLLDNDRFRAHRRSLIDDFARRLVAHNPLAEEAHRDVMRLSFLLGAIEWHRVTTGPQGMTAGGEPERAFFARMDAAIDLGPCRRFPQLRQDP